MSTEKVEDAPHHGERRPSRLTSVTSIPVELVAQKTGLKKTTVLALMFNGLVAMLGAAIIYVNSGFFNNTLMESLNKATTGALDVGRSEVSNFLNQQLTVRGYLLWRMQATRNFDNHLNRDDYENTVVPIMQSRDNLGTLYQGDVNSLHVLKFEKQGASQYYLEFRNHTGQSRHRKTCTIMQLPDAFNSTENVTCVENAPVSKSYDVRLKSWFEAGNSTDAITLQGPSFESYVALDINNPVSMSIIFALRKPKPSSEKIVYRLKVFIETLREAYSRVDLGSKGSLYLVKTDGTVVLSKNRLHGIGTNSLGEAVFKNIRDQSEPILQTLTPEQLGPLSESETITVTMAGDTNVAAAVAPLIFSEPVLSPFRLVVVTHRTDFAVTSIKYFELAKALGSASLGVACVRTGILLFSAYSHAKRGKAVYATS